MMAKETKHPKASFYSAVFEAVKEKTTASDDRFRKYIQVLLGDKDQEKVLEVISKVDKVFKEPSSSGRASPAQGPVPNRRSRYADFRCYYCQERGHYQFLLSGEGTWRITGAPREERKVGSFKVVLAFHSSLYLFVISTEVQHLFLGVMYEFFFRI